MKYNLVTSIEINSVEDLAKLKILVKANNLDKPNFSEKVEDINADYLYDDYLLEEGEYKLKGFVATLMR